jgi:hypothetical protein
VLRDLHGTQPIAEIAVWAAPMDGANGLYLGIAEGPQVDELVSTLQDDLNPAEHTEYGGGNWVPRSLSGPELLALVAGILQEALAETSAGWGQARPPCPGHSHPAGPGVSGGEAWWACPASGKLLWRIGEDAVAAPPSSPAT